MSGEVGHFHSLSLTHKSVFTNDAIIITHPRYTIITPVVFL